MKIGLYSVTYRGVWYRGEAIDLFSLVRLAKEQGWDGLEIGCLVVGLDQACSELPGCPSGATVWQPATAHHQDSQER